MTKIPITTIASLQDTVHTAGQMALDAQRRQRVSIRSLKQDGSVVTETDRLVDEYLFKSIAAAFPHSNILTEETAHEFDPAKAYTFAIDPVDGTDVFSQGMPTWCVCVGLLDASLHPVAGMVYAPALDLFLFADVAQPVALNGEPLAVEPKAPVGSLTNLMVPSSMLRELDLSRYPGKLRAFGSTALHISLPLVYPSVIGSISARNVHIWDLAAAHALIQTQGFVLQTFAGQEVNYPALVDGSEVGQNLVSAPATRLEDLKKYIMIK